MKPIRFEPSADTLYSLVFVIAFFAVAALGCIWISLIGFGLAARPAEMEFFALTGSPIADAFAAFCLAAVSLWVWRLRHSTRDAVTLDDTGLVVEFSRGNPRRIAWREISRIDPGLLGWNLRDGAGATLVALPWMLASNLALLAALYGRLWGVAPPPRLPAEFRGRPVVLWFLGLLLSTFFAVCIWVFVGMASNLIEGYDAMMGSAEPAMRDLWMGRAVETAIMGGGLSVFIVCIAAACLLGTWRVSVFKDRVEWREGMILQRAALADIASVELWTLRPRGAGREIRIGVVGSDRSAQMELARSLHFAHRAIVEASEMRAATEAQ